MSESRNSGIFYGRGCGLEQNILSGYFWVIKPVLEHTKSLFALLLFISSAWVCVHVFEWRRKALVGGEESGERVLSAGTRLLLFPTFFGLVCSSLHFSHTHSRCSSRDARFQTWRYVVNRGAEEENFLKLKCLFFQILQLPEDNNTLLTLCQCIIQTSRKVQKI